jgi:hypothetical protein
MYPWLKVQSMDPGILDTIEDFDKFFIPFQAREILKKWLGLRVLIPRGPDLFI